MPKRTRGYILTSKGAKKLEDAKREWENLHRASCTQEKIKELTSPFKANGLDLGTIRGIFNGDVRKDKKSIYYLFSAFNLQLEDDDLTSEPQACLPKLDPNFLGREEAIADLNTFVSQGAKVICIYGKGGVGKTTLAHQYFQTQCLEFFLELRIGIEAEDITPVEDWIHCWLRQYFKEEPEPNFLLMLEQLRRQLQNKKIGVLIDNLETALEGNGKFSKAHRRYVELLRLLVDSTVNSITLITSRERVNESKVIIQSYELPGLEEQAWHQFFSSRDMATDSAILGEMHRAYGGNTLSMKFLCNEIKTDYEGDLEIYWRHNQGNLLRRELRDLVVCQFNRLQSINKKAYRLLCRLGLYRYQKHYRISTVGVLCLLWDVPEEEQMQVIEFLENQCLIEVNKGEYWLHPVIRAQSLERLRSQGELKDELFILIKKKIDSLVAYDEKIQTFLNWVNWRSQVIALPYKKSALRAFYFFRAYLHPLNIDLILDMDLAHALDSTFTIDTLDPNLIIDLDLDLIHTCAASLVYNIRIYYKVSQYEAEIFAIAEDKYEINCEFLLNKSLNHLLALDLPSEVKQLFQALKAQLPVYNEEREKKKEWWKNQGRNWFENLRKVMIEDREIGYEWNFNEQQLELLPEYYYANELLVECLNMASDKVREEIEETLFLPIGEIERREAESNNTFDS